MKKKLCAILAIMLSLIVSICSFASEDKGLNAVINDTAKYIYQTVDVPEVGSVGGEWSVLGLARSGYSVPDKYYQDYYNRVEQYVKDCDGVLHKKKYTEHSRLAVALTSIGKDPENVGGYNLLTALGDYEKTIWQGINGSIWALIALDSGNYSMPQNSSANVQATRAMYVDRILDCQLEDGGFSLFGGTDFEASGNGKSDPDITGMALQALAKYQYRSDVKKVIDEALDTLSKLQNSEGGFKSWGSKNSESCVQVIVGLCELGITLDDPRFVKNRNTLLDNLLTFYRTGNGFLHTADGRGVNLMATEQAFYGIVSVKRMLEGQNSLYRMGDAISFEENENSEITEGSGLEGKHSDIKSLPIIYPGRTFDDITEHAYSKSIVALAERGMINGKGEKVFDPEATMTRGEFASIVIKSLGLNKKGNTKFADIPSGVWYEEYVGAAYSYGIINGRSDNAFDPMGAVTKEEAAVMIAKAAQLSGIDEALDKSQTRDMLAQFLDYVEVSDWARSSVALCYQKEILSQEEMEINPQQPIKRCEVAEMLFNLLNISNLI